MKNILDTMIQQLSAEDQIVFSKLAEKLKETNGDLSKLSKGDLVLVEKMENKYASKLKTFEKDIVAESTSLPLKAERDMIGNESLLTSGFASHARQILARDLKSRFPVEEDAVRFAYQNKWLPEDFKDPKLALQIFENFQDDICEANHWRDDLVGVESDKGLAVGLTWFMVIYQLHRK